MTLDRLVPGRCGRILAIVGDPGLIQRLYELGLMEGRDVEVIAIAPFGDPLEIRSGSLRLSLRKAEAAGIQLAVSL